MNAVVLTVKSCYVASTKYSRMSMSERGNSGSLRQKQPIVVWKMKVPEKKPLVKREEPGQVNARVRRSSTKRTANPIKVLSEFQS